MGRAIHSFEIPIMGKPIAWARTATVDEADQIRRITPKRYRSWKQRAAEVLAAGAGYRTFTGEVAIEIELHPDQVKVAVTALDPGDKRREGTGLQGDVDNYAKAVLDALQAGGVLRDDKAVAQLTVRIHPT